MEVSIIVIAHNERDYLRRCLKSLSRDEECARAGEIILIDNASSDGTGEMIAKNFPWINLIQNRKNKGVARARNQGLKKAKGKYIIFLDADTKALPDAFANLFRYMEENKDVGVVGPKLVYQDGSLQYSCRTFPTLLTFFARGFGFPENCGVLKKHLMLDWDHDLPCEVDWVMGACQMIRREAIEDVGFLDEGYFFGYEDIDFCYRAWKKGWKVVYMPKAVVVHNYQRKSAVRGLLNPIKWSHFRSAIRFFIKRMMT